MKQLSVTTYSSRSPLRRPVALVREMFTAIWSVRELTWTLFMRDLKAQYRESYLGYVWLIAPPFVTMLVWVFLNAQQIVRVETEIPYPLFVLIGTTVWSSFASSLNSPLAAFNAGKPVFMKLKVPPEAFVMSGFLRSVFDLSVRMLLLIPVFMAFKFTPTDNVIFFPVAIFALLAMALAAGLVLIPIGGFYGDVASAIASVIGLLMYTVPVVYPVPEGGGVLATVMRYNPLTPAVTLCRETLTSGDLTQLVPTLIWTGVSLIVILISFVTLRVAMPHLVARMGM